MSKVINLLPAGSTVSAGPTINSSTAGAALPFCCDQAVILVRSTAGTGVLTATLRLWGFQAEVARWYDLGGLNNASPIGETSIADTISYAEGVAGLHSFSRLYVEIVGALGGTTPAIAVEAACVPAETVTTS